MWYDVWGVQFVLIPTHNVDMHVMSASGCGEFASVCFVKQYECRSCEINPFSVVPTLFFICLDHHHHHNNNNSNNKGILAIKRPLQIVICLLRKQMCLPEQYIGHTAEQKRLILKRL